jgi:hypothetical protein
VLDINGVAHAGGVAVNIAQDPVADDDAPFLTSIVWEPDPLDPLFPLVITQPRVRARFNEGLDRVNVPTVTLYNLGPSPNPTVTSIEPTAAVLQDGGTDIVVTFPLGGIPDAFGPVPLLAVARNELMTAFIGPTTPAGPPPAAGLFDMHGNPSTSVNPQRRQALTLARNPLDIVAVPLEPVVVMWDANYGLNAGDVPEGYGLTALFSAELLDRINAENAGNYRVTNTAVNPRVPVSPLLPFILESGVTLDVSGVALTDGIQVHLEFGPAVLAGLARPLRTERAFLGGVDTLEINGSGSITDLNANVFPTFSQVAIAPNGADAVAPTVVSVAQRLELTSGLTKVIEVTFNEAMDAASITADDFRDILDDDGNPAGTLIPPATQIDADSVQFGEPATAFTTALGSSTKVFVYYVGRDIAQGGAVGNGSVTIGLVADINGNTVTPGATAIP